MSASMDLLADLEARGLVHDSTDLAALGRRLGEGGLGAYVGFDPTAPSLHVGHLLGQITLRRFQLAGHRPFPLAGGATGMVGDPSGRSDERNLLDPATLAANVAAIKGQLERLLDFEPGPCAATLVDNATWTAPLGVLDFLRDVGKHFTVNQMVAKESVRARMEAESGISFTEFTYMLLQANDYRWLAEHHDVELQMGGSDQWGNIVAGIDLVRRALGRSVHGLTWPLVARRDGQKMGKSVGGAVWLDPTLTSPYQFRQFWIQVGDDEVERFLLQFSLSPVSEIRDVLSSHAARPEQRLAQRTLADDLTRMVHGDAAGSAAEAAAAVLFGADPTTATKAALSAVADEVPGSTVAPGDVVDVVDLAVRTGLASSKGEARTLIRQGGLTVNGRKVTLEDRLGAGDALHGRFLVLRKGRTHYHLVEIGGNGVDGASEHL
jgi:tyrosyl-tRNA synthetase